MDEVKKPVPFTIKKAPICGRFDPPLQATYSAIYLPDGSLTCFGRKYMMRKILEERKKKHESDSH